MKKRLLAAALCSVMVMSLFACGGSDKPADDNKGTTQNQSESQSGETESTPEATTTVKPIVSEEEAITKDPIFFEDFNGDNPKITVVYHDNFDPTTGKPAVAGTMPTADAADAAGKTAIYTSEGSKDGTQVLSLDGTYGAILDYDWKDMESYTISFWINPARYAQYATMLTVGQDLLDAAGTVAWMNITKVKDWLGYDIAPVIWSRSKEASVEAFPNGKDGVNAGEEVWPWYCEAYCAAADGTQMTTKEWHHVVVTVDGSKTGWDPVLLEDVPGTVQATTYIDGQLFGTGPLAKYTMKDASDVYIGINCWDIVQKADYDNIAVYDYVLTGGQVFGLYNAQDGQ